MAFNLSQLAQRDIIEYNLKHPTADTVITDDVTGEPVVFTLYGPSSKQYRNAVGALQNERLKKGNIKITAEKMREDSINLLVACSQKAVNLELPDGDSVMTFDGIDNSAAFKKLYADPNYGWVKDQIDSALGDLGNFLA